MLYLGRTLKDKKWKICQKDRKRLIVHFRWWEQHQHMCEYAWRVWDMTRVVDGNDGHKFFPFLHPNPGNVILKFLPLRTEVCFPITAFGWPCDLLWLMDTSKCETSRDLKSAYALGILCLEAWDRIVIEPRLSWWRIKWPPAGNRGSGWHLLTTRDVSEFILDHPADPSFDHRHMGESTGNLLSAQTEWPRLFV